MDPAAQSGELDEHALDPLTEQELDSIVLAQLDATLLIEELIEGEPDWVRPIKKALNAQSRALKRLTRKVEQMSANDTAQLDQITKTLEGVETTDTALGASVAELVTSNQSLVNEVAALQAGSTELPQSVKDSIANILTHAGNIAAGLTQVEAAAAAGAGGAPSGGGTPVEQPTTAAKPLYTFSGDPASIDATVWVNSGKFAADGTTPLYEFASDVAGEAAKGANAEWVVYTGEVKDAPAAEPAQGAVSSAAEGTEPQSQA